MMTRMLVSSLRQVCKVQTRQASNVPPLYYGQMHGDVYWGGKKYNKIGDREIVGHGFNGEPSYIDCSECPFPAIRYKEVTPDIRVLREKEKGDWSKLSIQEKKLLYRTSFRQTFAEFEASLGDWKGCVGWACVFISIALWVFVSFKVFSKIILSSKFTLKPFFYANVIM